MRLGTTARWILTIGVFAILLGSAAYIYMREQDEQEELRAQLEQARATLEQYRAVDITSLVEQKEDLQEELYEVQAREIERPPRFGDYPESIEINGAVFETADRADVTVMSLTSSHPKHVDLQGIRYRAYDLNVTVTGEVLPELINFCTKLDDTFAPMKWASADASIAEETATLNLAFTVYYLSGEWIQ
ncbi:MAG: hypothetical protein ACOC58_02185 [Chloroflexota bacterium]